MTANYSYLFRLQLQHEYFRDLKSVNLSVEPAEDTLQLFRGAHILWQKGSGQYTAMIRNNGLQEPFTNTVSSDGVSSEKAYRTRFGKNIFRFYIKHTNHAFANYTNMDLGMQGRCFYFSNLSGNRRNNYPFLSQKIEDHVSGTVYNPGRLVMEPGTENVFECIRKHTSTSSSLTNETLWAPKGLRFLRTALDAYVAGKTYQVGDLVLKPATTNVFESLTRHVGGTAAELSNTAIWKPRGMGQLQYPTDNDITVYSSGQYSFVLPAPVTQATIKIFGFNFNAATPAYNVPVVSDLLLTLPEASANIPVDLSFLRPGKYRVEVNGDSRLLYHDPQLARPGTIGIIEIFNHLPAGNPYSFLDASEKFRSLSYNIFFPARRVLWKYIPKDGRAISVIDSLPGGFSFAPQQDGFVSTVPIQLSEEVLSSLELRFSTDDFKLLSLPNPVVHRLGKCTQNGFDYLCSEMYLNY